MHGMKPWLLIALAALFFSAIYVVRIQEAMVDFEVNYRAGQRLTAGETLYQTRDGHYMFKYLPFSALFYVPLSTLPLDVAKPVWFGFSVVAAWWLFRLSRRLVPQQNVTARYLDILPAVILAKFFFHELRLGQINILVTLVMLVAVRALPGSGTRSVRAELFAGTMVGLATALKPYAILFLPYFIVKRHGWCVAAWLGFVLFALAVPSVFYGVEGNFAVLKQWVVTLSASTPTLLTTNDNVSVIAFLMKWTSDLTFSLVLTGVVLGAVGVVMLAIVAKGRSVMHAAVLESAIMLILIPLVSPLGWDYTFLMSVLGITLLINYFVLLPRLGQIVLAANFAVIALALYDLMGREAYSIFMQSSITTVNFLLIVGYLAYLRFRRVC